MDEFRANAATMSERERLIYLAAFHNAYPLFFSFVLTTARVSDQQAAAMLDKLASDKAQLAALSATTPGNPGQQFSLLQQEANTLWQG